MTAKHTAEKSSLHWLRHIVFVCSPRRYHLHDRFNLAIHAAASTISDVETVTRFQADWLQKNPWTPVIMPVVFAIGGLFLFVHAVLLWATAFIFPPGPAILYCQELGSLASGLTVYGLGRVLRPAVIKRLGGSSVGRVMRAIWPRTAAGPLSCCIGFRFAPFSMLNLLAGATHIELGDFLIGAQSPAACRGSSLSYICLIGHRIVHVLHHPSRLEIGLSWLHLWSSDLSDVANVSEEISSL